MSAVDEAPDGDQSAVHAEHQSPGMPRWVKVALLVAAALVVLFLVAQLAGVGGEHGPGRHGGGDTRPPMVNEGDDGRHAPPVKHGPGMTHGR